MPLAAPVINSTLSSTIARFPLFLFSVFNHRSCKRCANREGRKIRREGGRNRRMSRHKKTFPECRKGQDAEMSGKRLLFRIHRRRSPGRKNGLPPPDQLSHFSVFPERLGPEGGASLRFGA